MAELGDLRIRLVQDDDSLQEIYSGGFSNVKELQDETKAKIESGEWNSYATFVETAVPGGWEVVDSLGGTVTQAGYEGTYDTIEAIRNEDVRNAVSQVWDEVLATLAENTVAPAQTESTFPLGRAIGFNAYRPRLDVVGHVRNSDAGNTVMQIGSVSAESGTGWLHSATVVLAPHEREHLIAKLIAERDN